MSRHQSVPIEINTACLCESAGSKTKFFKSLLITVIALGAMLCIVAGCGKNNEKSDTASELSSPSTLRLAVSTSTQDSGLLDVLIPLFEEQQQVQIDVVAVGSGKALKLGETGQVDAAWVHSRHAELPFMDAGHGIRREEVMVNYFEILGPPNDPAEIQGTEPSAAFRKILALNHKFISRGDESGTHNRELTLWWTVGGPPKTQAYVETGKGMGETLLLADRNSAYVLADRGTYLRFKPKIKLVPLIPKNPQLRNPYGIVVVNPLKGQMINEEKAQAFADFLISPNVQQIIGNFQIEDEQLFQPLRLSENRTTTSSLPKR